MDHSILRPQSEHDASSARLRYGTVSIGAAGVLHWAALIGDDDPRGTWRFSPEAGDGSPEMLRYILTRIYR